ncbi:LLM class flavin-dependent oxidoreductase [Streptomyces sp. NPDC020192]|uniref:LLM class flavin-dependent oxidoreductase n=1 Tax=Streptomyces sp. NPDC020192 TaxID=3365066 RepID=UPI0037900B9E
MFFQGVNHWTIWSAPDSGSQIDLASFRRVAQTAERGLFDAFFLGEGLRLREADGRIHDLDVAGRPDAITQLAALAAVTRRIGLVSTSNSTFSEPADLARRLSGYDRGGGAGEEALDPAPTGHSGHRVGGRRAAVGHRPVRPGHRQAAAQGGPGRHRERRFLRRPAHRRPAGGRGREAREGGGEPLAAARDRHRARPAARPRRHPVRPRRHVRPLRAARLGRRLQRHAVPDPGRPRRHRGPAGAEAPGTRRLPHRLGLREPLTHRSAPDRRQAG